MRFWSCGYSVCGVDASAWPGLSGSLSIETQSCSRLSFIPFCPSYAISQRNTVRLEESTSTRLRYAGAVMGHYENGSIILHEPAAVPEHIRVIVTFLSRDEAVVVGKERIPGSVKGRIWMADDFDAPLDDLKKCV